MKANVLSIILAGVFISGAIILVGGQKDEGTSTEVANVSMSGGKQVIEINAKGGYTPSNTVAKANTPTVLKVKTNGTFDCSSALIIPSISYEKHLPASGETIIEIPPQKPGSTLQGLCKMGMYNFSVAFN